MPGPLLVAFAASAGAESSLCSSHQPPPFCTAAHKAASAADTATARPQLTAFAAWLLRRFEASHGVQPALFGTRAPDDARAPDVPAAGSQDARSALPEPATSAQAAFAAPANGSACEHVRALGEAPQFTIVLRTAKRNGNVRAQPPSATCVCVAKCGRGHLSGCSQLHTLKACCRRAVA